MLLLLLLSCWEQSFVESPQHDESLKSDEAAAAAASMSLKGGNGDKNEYKKVLGSTWEYSGYSSRQLLGYIPFASD